MKKNGIIYDYLWSRSSGELVVAITRAAKIAYHATKVLASSLIVVGLAGLFFTMKPVVSSEVAYNWGRITGQIEKEQEQHSGELVALAQQNRAEQEKEAALKMAQQLGLPDARFGLYIPKINAKAPVIENVSVTSEKEYMGALQKGVAHASGSVFPGMDGATFLFAHSSEIPWNVGAQYNTIFYLLRELEAGSNENVPLGGGPAEVKGGDEIYVFFLDKIYKYRVTEKHTVQANDVSWLIHAKEGKERLVLQTCWPPGTALKRLIIVAEPVVE